MHRAAIVAVAASPRHGFSKTPLACVRLLAGLGVEGDAHCGATVRHRYARRRDPSQPNLRQVHLLAAEVFVQLAAQGHSLAAGELGENLTTERLDLPALPRDTRLHIGETAVIRLTGLRTPCVLIERFRAGLLAAVRGCSRDPQRWLSGVMAVVDATGTVRPGDVIEVELPALPHLGLAPI